MKKIILIISLLSLFMFADVNAQGTHWMFGARLGLSVGSGGGESAVGFQFGPTVEAIFQNNMAVGTELNINTQTSTPIEWADYFKYYFSISGSNIKPYVNGGFSLWFYTGGPYFGLRFGGGVNIPVANNLYIPADIQLGPVFGGDNTVFYFAITTGIKYRI